MGGADVPKPQVPHLKKDNIYLIGANEDFRLYYFSNFH
jgi:hypothetical protein